MYLLSKMIKKERFIMGKVYGYCRVALASKEEIDEQMRTIAKYCKGNNLKVDEFFCDDGVSGFDVGPEFKHLLDELKSGDTVIVKNLSRVSRGNIRLIQLMGSFKDEKIKIVCVDENDLDISPMRVWLEQRWTKQMRDE
jgi:DNA invertase Pin-like site-specific DNA recombinase